MDKKILWTLIVVAVVAFVLLNNPNLVHALFQSALMLGIIALGYFFLGKAFKTLFQGQQHGRRRRRR